MSSYKQRDLLAKTALKRKLGYLTEEKLNLLTDGAPNSTAIHDLNTDLVWKVLWFKESDNPYLEQELLEKLPQNDYVLKSIKADTVLIGSDEHSCLVFPYKQGYTLEKLIDKRNRTTRQPFSYDEIYNLADKVTQGIALMYKHGIIHQDIKPGNLIVNNDEVTIIDLGIAKFVENNFQKFKSLKAPYAYLSPEKLLLVANSKFTTWSSLTFASDLFSLGLILFEMATLKCATKDMKLKVGELDKLEEKLSELDIEEKTKKLISPFLLPSAFDRQIEVAKLFNLEWEDNNHPKNSRFWFHSGWHSPSFYEKYFASEIRNINSPFGYIYPLEIIQSQNKLDDIKTRAKQVKDLGGLFAADPCTYLQLLDKKHHRGLKYLKYYFQLSTSHIISPPQFEPNFLANYITEVINEQNNFGSDILISPYFYLERLSSDNVEANFVAWYKTYEIVKSKSITKPVYYGLLLAESLIQSEKEMKELALIVSNQKYAENIYIRIESERPDSSHIVNKEYLSNLKLFLSFLSKGKNILLASCGFEGIALMGCGVNELSTHYEFSKRKFSLKNKTTIRDASNQPDLRYFVRTLLNEMKLRQELMGIPIITSIEELKRIFECNCPYCPNSDEESVYKHFLYHMHDMFNKLSLLSNEERHDLINEWLSTAKKGYLVIQQYEDIKLSTSSSGEFIAIWENALN